MSSWKRQNQLGLTSGNWLPVWKKGGKRDAGASQPIAGGGGSPRMGRDWKLSSVLGIFPKQVN